MTSDVREWTCEPRDETARAHTEPGRGASGSLPPEGWLEVRPLEFVGRCPHHQDPGETGSTETLEFGEDAP